MGCACVAFFLISMASVIFAFMRHRLTKKYRNYVKVETEVGWKEFQQLVFQPVLYTIKIIPLWFSHSVFPHFFCLSALFIITDLVIFCIYISMINNNENDNYTDNDNVCHVIFPCSVIITILHSATHFIFPSSLIDFDSSHKSICSYKLSDFVYCCFNWVF